MIRRPPQPSVDEVPPPPEDIRSRGLFRALRTVSLWTLISRVLGLARDTGMAALFGSGAVFDAFSVAFRLPNLARRLFGEGALTATFLPAFVRLREQHGDDPAWRLAGFVLPAMTGILLLLVGAGELLLWAAGHALAASPETLLLLSLTAVLLPYVVLICLAAQLSAILHACGRFALPAVLPVLLNLIWIAAVLLAPRWTTDPVEQVHLICRAILLAGLLQCLAPLPLLYRLGFRREHLCHRSVRDSTSTDPVRHSLAVLAGGLLPVMLGLSITQINTLADSLLAWGLAVPETANAREWWQVLPSGTASALYLGQRLYQFPLGVFGVALGTVLFPRLARHAAAGETNELRHDLSLGLRLVTVIGLPASVGLMLLAEPLSDVLFRHGQFSAGDSRHTAHMIAACGAGVWASCGLLIANRCCLALGDRTTPVKIGLWSVALNLLLNALLIPVLAGPGLAVATSLTTAIQCAVTVRVVAWRVGPVDWQPVWRTLRGSLVATALMTLACLAIMAGLAAVFGGPTGEPFEASRTTASATHRLAALGAPLLTGIAVYLLACRLLGLKELSLLLRRRGSEQAS